MLVYAGVRPEGTPSMEDASKLYPHYEEVPALSGSGSSTLRERSEDDEAGTLLVGAPEQIAADIDRTHRAGTSHYILDFGRHGLEGADSYRRDMQTFAEQVFPLVT